MLLQFLIKRIIKLKSFLKGDSMLIDTWELECLKENVLRVVLSLEVCQCCSRVYEMDYSSMDKPDIHICQSCVKTLTIGGER